MQVAANRYDHKHGKFVKSAEKSLLTVLSKLGNDLGVYVAILFCLCWVAGCSN